MSIYIEHPAKGLQSIELNNYIPPTRKELIFKENPEKFLDLPCLHKGVEIKISTNYLIMTRFLSIPKNLIIPTKIVWKFPKYNKIALSKKISYIKKGKEIDIILTNRAIIETYNELTKEIMTTARKYKIKTLLKDMKQRFPNISNRVAEIIVKTVLEESKKYNINPMILYALGGVESSHRHWIEHDKVTVQVENPDGSYKNIITRNNINGKILSIDLCHPYRQFGCYSSDIDLSYGPYRSCPSRLLTRSSISWHDLRNIIENCHQSKWAYLSYRNHATFSNSSNLCLKY